MYANKPSAKTIGALSMAVPGELAGLHAIWSKYGRLPWKDLFQPAIKLAREGYILGPYVAAALKSVKADVFADPGLREVFAPKGKLLEAGEICYNPALADTLETIANEGAEAFYNGSIGEKLIEDVKGAGGIVTLEDLRSYKVKTTEPMTANVMGYTLLGMPVPSSGTVGMSLVLNVLGGYNSTEYLKGFLGIHRLIEALKHMFAIRMDLGDPDYVNIANTVSDMMSPSFADQIRQTILDNTTFNPSYYMAKWSQLRDHGTSHVCIVDADRNAVSLTTTVNTFFGARILSKATGIVLNDEMGDFSTPTDATRDHLPPAPANFIEPGKRPLSSMTPIIVTKDNQLAGVAGASGGMNIIPAVIEVFLNHYIVGMDPLAAVQHPRVFHELIPNVVTYENLTAIDGEPIIFDEDAKLFLEQRGHRLESKNSTAAVCQFIVHNLEEPILSSHVSGKLSRRNSAVFHGMLTAVSDPRKDGSPAGL